MLAEEMQKFMCPFKDQIIAVINKAHVVNTSNINNLGNECAHSRVILT